MPAPDSVWSASEAYSRAALPKRKRVRQGAKPAARLQMLAAAREAFVREPVESASLARIARTSGLPLAALRETWPTALSLYRSTIVNAFTGMARELRAWRPPADGPVSRLVNDYVAFAWDILSSEAARNIAYLILRDSAAHPWLVEQYRNCIVAPAALDLQKEIKRAGRRMAMDLAVSAAELEGALIHLQWQANLPQLLPSFSRDVEIGRHRTTRDVAAKILSSIRSVDAGADSSAAA